MNLHLGEDRKIRGGGERCFDICPSGGEKKRFIGVSNSSHEWLSVCVFRAYSAATISQPVS